LQIYAISAAAALLGGSNVVLAAQYMVTWDSGAGKQQVLKPIADSEVTGLF
jgi:hypothetical protein